VRGKHQSGGQPSKRKGTETLKGEAKKRKGTETLKGEARKRKGTETHKGEAKKRKGSLPKVGTAFKETRKKKSGTLKDRRIKRDVSNKETLVTKSREKTDSPKKGKTITQRLVIKMAFTSGDGQQKSSKKESKTLKSVKAKVKRKSNKDRQNVSDVKCQVDIIQRDKSDLVAERREDCYVTPKKNPRFREAVEDVSSVTNTHGANVFDMFDKDGQIVADSDVKSSVDGESKVNGTQSDNPCVKLDPDHSNAAGSKCSNSLTRLKRRGSGNIDYAKLSGKNKRLSTERKISSRKSENGSLSVTETAVKSVEKKPFNDSCDEGDNVTKREVERESDSDSVCGSLLSGNEDTSLKVKDETASVHQLGGSQAWSSTPDMSIPNPELVEFPDVSIPNPELVEANDDSLDIGKVLHVRAN
jgi:hypothetical protein